MNNLELLSPRILDNYKPNPLIAIVGNSGINDIDDNIIENADIVVRFNDYATRDKIQHTKDKYLCDILFSTFDLHSVGSKPKDVVIGIPFPFKADQIYHKPKKLYPSSRVWMVNPYLNMNMCKEMNIDSLGACHPLPSIGFTALWHLHTFPCNIFIAGFNWYYDKKTKLFQGLDLKNKNYPENWNHNYPKEIEWILKYLYYRDNIIFSSECKSVLKIAIKQIG